MKTIERYVFGSFLSSFVLAFLVLSFVMTVALLVQIVGLILDGVSPRLVGEFALVSFPETMQWTIPLSLLVSSVLVFSRLSADSEIAAMRACGINMASVMKWPVLFALGCSVLGAWVNNEIVPRGHEVRRNLKTKVSVDTAIDLLEPGMWNVDFPKVKIYFSRKEGNWLYDLLVMDYTNPRVDRTIHASSALVVGEGRDVKLDLRGMTVDPLDETHPGMMSVNRYLYVVKDALKEAKYTKKGKDLRFRELVAKIREMDRSAGEAKADGGSGIRRELRRSASKLKVELSKRFVFAMASLCFVLVGVPLGIRAQRRESTVGMAVSLAIALGYYLVMMLMLSMQKSYAIHPEYLIWLPVLTCFALAAVFIRKHL